MAYHVLIISIIVMIGSSLGQDCTQADIDQCSAEMQGDTTLQCQKASEGITCLQLLMCTSEQMIGQVQLAVQQVNDLSPNCVGGNAGPVICNHMDIMACTLGLDALGPDAGNDMDELCEATEVTLECLKILQCTNDDMKQMVEVMVHETESSINEECYQDDPDSNAGVTTSGFSSLQLTLLIGFLMLSRTFN